MKRATILAATAFLLALPALAAFNRPDWKWFREVELPPTSGKYAAIAIDPVTFGHVQSGLHDLRVIGPDGAELPWALVTRRGGAAVTAFRPEILNQSVTPGTAGAASGGAGVSVAIVDVGGAVTVLRPTVSERPPAPDGAQELVLDLGNPGIRHSRIRLEIDADNFRREVNLYGSDDGAAWKEIVRGLDIFDLRGDGARVSRLALNYPACIYRYVKLEIPLAGEKPLAVRSAEVELVEREEAVVSQVAAAKIEPRPQPDGRYTDFSVSFGAENIPVETLALTVTDPEFSREVEVWDAAFTRRVGGGLIYRYEIGGRQKENLSISVGAPLGDFGLRVIDHDDQPLQLTAVTARTIVRTLVFRAPASGPVRLYLGNPAAPAPVYDLARYLPRSDVESIALARPGALKDNPDYAPPKPPRDWRFLIWISLGAAVLVLGWLIFRSAKQIQEP